MKRILFLLTFCTAVLCASASNKYVKPDGSDSNDGKSWPNAFATIQKAINNCPSGDTVFIAGGEYNETFSVGNGVTLLGGYNAADGGRDIELYETILDGTDKGKYIIVKYDAPPADLITIDGLTFRNAIHSQWGGGAIYMRDNMLVSNCKFINCQGGTSGAIFIDHADDTYPQAVVRNCLIELCQSPGGSAAAIYNNNGIVENCIIRGCVGRAGVIRNETAASITRNCLIYNNTITGTWPNSAIYNKGTVINCTVCNNYGDQYPGIHSDGDSYFAEVYNSVFWGNRNPESMSDPANFINGDNSLNNVADEGFGNSAAFITRSLAASNTAADGPNFRNPTTFVGAPANDGEIAIMRNADFSITDASTPLLNAGDASHATAADIDGVARPKGTGVDIGAYEYDPDAVAIAVTGVSILQDTLKVIKGKTDALNVIITPADANNKRVTWSIDDPTVASIQNGAVTGLREDTTIARVTTQDGGFTASAVVVVLPVPPVKYPDEVVAADALYPMENYTVPSFIPFLIAKEAARIDSLDPESDLTVIPERIAAMNEAATKLVGKEEPYNMIANINGDPATRMAFCWFTNEGVTNGSVQLIPAANATVNDFETCDCLITVAATPTTTVPLNYAVFTSGIAEATHLSANQKFTYVSHKALAENLTPGTTYSWRVGYEGHWSGIAQFTTKAADQGDFSFLYMTDSHIQDAEYVENARWCATAAAQNEQDVKFCVFPGDFVETGTQQNSEWEWERWFEESIKPVIMKMPMVVTDGNHDDSENLNYDYHFNTDWGFYNAAQTKPQFHGITYSFVYGDVLFLVFSMQDYWRAHGTDKEAYVCSYLSNDVKNWFKEQIALHPDTKYRVTLAHKNIFSGSGHQVDSETPLFREIMLPIFKECEIDLALQGHDHCYEVIGPVDPDTRTAITSAISGVQDVEVNTNTNMTGKEGGTFVTDEGTLYFIGATCGRKRYYPYSREKMDSYYDKHKVTNYFDLMTSMLGQPEAPSYTRVNVSDEGIELKSYKTDADGNSTLFNTIRVVRNTPHTVPSGYDNVAVEPKEGEKFIRNGQLYILKDGRIYNALGEPVANKQ